MFRSVPRGRGITPIRKAGNSTNGTADVWRFENSDGTPAHVQFAWFENRTGATLYIEIFDQDVDGATTALRASKAAPSGNNLGSTFKLADGDPGLPMTIAFSTFSVYYDGAGTFTNLADPGFVFKGWLEART